jgi:hypothetical protein
VKSWGNAVVNIVSDDEANDVRKKEAQKCGDWR